MNRLKQLKTYPFGLFLVLEWIFLGAAILGEWPNELLWQKYFASSPSASSAFSPFFSLLCLIALGLMGLRLPRTNKNNNFNKWLYLLLQLALLWIPFLQNSESTWYITAYLVIVIRACLIFELKETVVATTLILIVVMASIFLYYPDFLIFQSASAKSTTITLEQYKTIKNIGMISALFLFGLCVACISIMIKALQREYDSRQKLALAHNKLREYAMLAEDKATLDERNRIAREIHDSLGHALTAQSIQLDNAIAFWQLEPTKAYNFLTEAKTLVTTALQEIRYSVATMRADPLQEQNLEIAIATLLKEFSQRTTIVPQCHISLLYPLSKEVKTTLYRIVQEALTNISKHSEATKVIVELTAFPEHLSLLITDNGKGFDPQQNTTGFGLQGVRERVAALAGYLQMSSDFGRGCTITINIPRRHSLIS
ncbi:MAG: sensor histidine kinase [Waterburya sp.]